MAGCENCGYNGINPCTWCGTETKTFAPFNICKQCLWDNEADALDEAYKQWKETGQRPEMLK